MAHFYGFIEGQAGSATRMGSKRSGYRAWAQNSTSRVAVDFQYAESRERDLGSLMRLKSRHFLLKLRIR